MGSLLARARRVAALLANPNVPRLPRLAVAAAVVYLLWPVDLIPDFLVPIGGFLDDATFLWLALRWLVGSARSAGVEEGLTARPR